MDGSDIEGSDIEGSDIEGQTEELARSSFFTGFKFVHNNPKLFTIIGRSY